jgi:hypothetical protein
MALDFIDGIGSGIMLGALIMAAFSLPRITPVVKYQMWLDREIELESEAVRLRYLDDKERLNLAEAELFAHQVKKPKMPWPERLWNKK